MKEQFVTYEIALGLKELGFDEECFAIFFRTILNNGRTVNYISDDWESPFYKNRTNSESNSVDIVSAPLWQQVVDWFREKHNIHIVVSGKLIDYSEHKTYLWEIYGDFEELPGEPYEGLDKDYYKARKQAILKAIEICKENL